MATLGLHRDFLPQYAKLDKSVRDRVDKVFGKFDAHTHAGLHLEKITGAKDSKIRTIRITDFWRGVVVAHDSGSSYLLLNVLPHDKAIEWARNRRVTENKLSGGIEVRNDVALATATQNFRRLDSAPAEASAKLFDHVSDADLSRLGIDDDIRTMCRLLRSADELDALGNLIPETQYDALAGLAAGLTPEAVWQELAQHHLPAEEPESSTGETGDTDELAAAMKRSQGYIAVVNDSEELADILEWPFDLWRVFLHPAQRRIAEHAPYSGPARITGGAGTGKTVVALHRAHHLARNPDLPENAILLTTFTKNLAEELARNLDVLIADPVVRSRIEVVNVDVIARRHIPQGSGKIPAIIDRTDRLVRWRRLLRKHELDLPESFLDQEWRQVVLAQEITTAEQYRAADRRGRGKALPPTLKDALWEVFAEFTAQLREEGYWTFEEVADTAAHALREHTDKPYRHVVVDEAQDLHPSRWRMLRALVEHGTDDLFIAGDTHQRIYDNRASLRSLGIHVAGRSSKLRINYRTSREILVWSTALLLGERADDMDGGEEDLAGYRSSFRGEIPATAAFDDKTAEIAGIVDRVRGWLATGIPAETIGIAARTSQFGKDVAAGLEAAGIGTAQLGGDAGQDGVRIGTMHKMKGLEFRCVLVADVGERTVPMPSAVTDEAVDAQQHQQDLQAERNLLFVACTRARDSLCVTWHGRPSEFLQPVLDAG
ncbi:UvrD-like helicase family protein [Halopolyspora algeriensis]|uniref:DNA 3'-5' helicase n=1 Tax=Halopolyspora algeriensis TaxID=1500506 RepID=A0A368VVC4_9ACTN|nr:UvrD-helicase domain-containing protein [Halopolyspora algeriensis]RCW45845.1 UvrD-like helicase family protein [Halopolyspora algeriensis]TQM55260.1 UvrD-like helicase family protein [Halopolyspora algeriensis]